MRPGPFTAWQLRYKPGYSVTGRNRPRSEYPSRREKSRAPRPPMLTRGANRTGRTPVVRAHAILPTAHAGCDVRHSMDPICTGFGVFSANRDACI